ncbi:MAG: N-formylglutamate amidohydrolase [Alphaproteobacteria bacterium]
MDDIKKRGSTLLGPSDPAPVTVVNPDGARVALLVCDHATNAVPAALQGLGLTERDLHHHIALDIGAAEVTRELARLLDAPAVLPGYSRLVVDCNRRLEHPSSIVALSDGVEIPGNRDLTEADRRVRIDECFWPYHRRIGAGLAGFAMRDIRPAIISVHGFTPVLNGTERPWHVGVLWDGDSRIAQPLLAALSARAGLVVGDNEPYSGRQRYGYTIEVHATETGLANVLVEIREDLVADADGQLRIASLLAETLAPIMSGLEET